MNLSCLRKNSLYWEVVVMWSKQIFHLIVLPDVYQEVYVSLCMSLLPLKCPCCFWIYEDYYGCLITHLRIITELCYGTHL